MSTQNKTQSPLAKIDALKTGAPSPTAFEPQGVFVFGLLICPEDSHRLMLELQGFSNLALHEAVIASQAL